MYLNENNKIGNNKVYKKLFIDFLHFRIIILLFPTIYRFVS